jgi:purine-binding chemotaxis protein CheW
MATESINAYLTFKIGEEVFAAHVSKVISILELTRITKMPNTPPYVLGVINLRGAVLPIIDTRIKFRMPITAFSTTTCIIVIEINSGSKVIKLGALVDGVKEVMQIDDDKIQTPPEIGGKFQQDYIIGMFENNNSFIMILDLDKIFSTDKIIAIVDPEYENFYKSPEDLTESVSEETTSDSTAKEEEEKWIQEALDDSQENKLDQNQIAKIQVDLLEPIIEQNEDTSINLSGQELIEEENQLISYPEENERKNEIIHSIENPEENTDNPTSHQNIENEQIIINSNDLEKISVNIEINQTIDNKVEKKDNGNSEIQEIPSDQIQTDININNTSAAANILNKIAKKKKHKR